jgi:alpha-L-rhamnosidase
MAGQRDYPGWGDMLRRGATTLWEDWEGKLSLLHSSYLYIGAWPMEGLAGIKPGPDGGFREFILKPGVCGQPGLDFVRAAYDSEYGLIRSAWRVQSGRLHVEATVPPNTSATLHLPTTDPASVTESGRPAGQQPGVLLSPGPSRKDRAVQCSVFHLEPGRYKFQARYEP